MPNSEDRMDTNSSVDQLINGGKTNWYQCFYCGFEGFKEEMVNPKTHTYLITNENPYNACYDFLESVELIEDKSYKHGPEYKAWNNTWL